MNVTHTHMAASGGGRGAVVGHYLLDQFLKADGGGRSGGEGWRGIAVGALDGDLDVVAGSLRCLQSCDNIGQSNSKMKFFKRKLNRNENT